MSVWTALILSTVAGSSSRTPGTRVHVSAGGIYGTAEHAGAGLHEIRSWRRNRAGEGWGACA
ncbi:hypothetical protein [Thermosporothrix hazakensis]|uniref:hypothetical protein n=1 Tax=Thermosporothrix hazakensis TaxID=644383 RepID=UPI001B8738BE|nr:hypothetical protein [Thermosporothrix hazakensis]